MVKPQLKVSWDKQALHYFAEAISYIREDSPKNADKVKNEVLKTIRALTQSPEKHPPDKYKVNNDKSFRAFEIYHLRVSYRIKQDEIIIARIRHTSQQPQQY